jgi:hypothetical protein
MGFLPSASPKQRIVWRYISKIHTAPRKYIMHDFSEIFPLYVLRCIFAV